jgi:hypothetical protein
MSGPPEFCGMKAAHLFASAQPGRVKHDVFSKHKVIWDVVGEMV